MPPEDGRQTRNISGVCEQALICQLCDGFLHVDGVAVGKGIEGDTKGSQLFFLHLAQRVADLAPLSVVDFSRQLVAEFLAVGLDEYSAPEAGAADIVQDMQGFDEAAQLHECFRQSGGSFAKLKNAHDARSFQVPKLEGVCKTDPVFPIVGEEIGIDGACGDCVKGTVVCGPPCAPQPCTADVRQSWTKLIAQKPEQAKNGIGVDCGIGHYLQRIEFCFLLQEQGKNGKTVTQGAGNRHDTQAGILIREHILPSDAPALTEVHGLEPACMALLGAKKRRPSAETVCPSPQCVGICGLEWAETMRRLAAASVSWRMKFWLTQDRRLWRSAG